jgi:hypothetical protein
MNGQFGMILMMIMVYGRVKIMNASIFMYKGSERITKTIKNIDNDIFLQVGDKQYRFDYDHEGNLILALINGCDVKIKTYNGYPAIQIISER